MQSAYYIFNVGAKGRRLKFIQPEVGSGTINCILRRFECL